MDFLYSYLGYSTDELYEDRNSDFLSTHEYLSYEEALDAAETWQKNTGGVVEIIEHRGSREDQGWVVAVVDFYGVEKIKRHHHQIGKGFLATSREKIHQVFKKSA